MVDWWWCHGDLLAAPVWALLLDESLLLLGADGDRWCSLMGTFLFAIASLLEQLS